MARAKQWSDCSGCGKRTKSVLRGVDGFVCHNCSRGKNVIGYDDCPTFPPKKCIICKRMSRKEVMNGICSKCRNRTLGCLIKDGLIEPKHLNTIVI